MPLDKKEAFLRKCEEMSNLTHAQVSLECIIARNALRFSFNTEWSPPATRTWHSPFVDIFFFEVDKGEIKEVSPRGRPPKWPLDQYFPTRLYYYGGLYMPGPREEVSFNRYDVNKCVVASFIHRLENYTKYSRKWWTAAICGGGSRSCTKTDTCTMVPVFLM